MNKPNEKPGGKKPNGYGFGGGGEGGRKGNPPNNNNSNGQNSQTFSSHNSKPVFRGNQYVPAGQNSNYQPSGQISQTNTSQRQQQSVVYERRVKEDSFLGEDIYQKNHTGGNNKNVKKDNLNVIEKNNIIGYQTNTHQNNSISNNGISDVVDQNKKCLGKNKFHQIYNEIAQNRKNGMESGDMSWLNGLRMQFPQIFSAEHLAPLFTDKGFSERFNAAEAFEIQEKKIKSGNITQLNKNDQDNDKKGSTSNPLGKINEKGGKNNNNINNSNNINNNNSNSLQVNKRRISNLKQNKNFQYDLNPSSESDPEWEVDENNFDFEFKTFDKEKHAQQMKEQLERQRNNSRTNNNQDYSMPKSVPSDNRQQPNQDQQRSNQIKSDHIKEGEDSSTKAIEQGGFSADQFFSMVLGAGNLAEGQVLSQPAANAPHLEDKDTQEYVDIDAMQQILQNEEEKRRKQKESEKEKTFESLFEHIKQDTIISQQQQQMNGQQGIASKDTIISQRQSEQMVAEIKEPRQIVMNTIIQSEFQDEVSSDDEDNDETFGPSSSHPNVPNMTQHTNISNQNQFRTSLISAGIITPVKANEVEQSQLIQSQQQQNNFMNQPILNQGGFNTGKDEMTMYLDSLQDLNQDKKHISNKDSSSEDNEKQHYQIDNHPLESSNQELLEELIIQQNRDLDDAEEMCASFLLGNEEERKLQVIKRKELEKRNNEKISEILSQKEQENQNYFSAVAYLLQANPCEAIWVYKDDKAIIQGPFESIQMDQWKEHFKNTEVSYSKTIYWIKYTDLVIYFQRYSVIIKTLSDKKPQQHESNQQYQAQSFLQNQQQQQRQSQINQNGIINQQKKALESQYLNLRDPSISQQQIQQYIMEQQEIMKNNNQVFLSLNNQQQEALLKTGMNETNPLFVKFMTAVKQNPQAYMPTTSQQQFELLQKAQQQQQQSQSQLFNGSIPQNQSILTNSSKAFGVNFQNQNNREPQWMQQQTGQIKNEYLQVQQWQNQWQSKWQQQQQNVPLLQQAQRNNNNHYNNNYQPYKQQNYNKRNPQNNNFSMNNNYNSNYHTNNNNTNIISNDTQNYHSQLTNKNTSQEQFFYQNSNSSRILSDNIGNPNQRQNGEHQQRNQQPLNGQVFQGQNATQQHGRFENPHFISSQSNQIISSNESVGMKPEKTKKKQGYEQDFPSLS